MNYLKRAWAWKSWRYWGIKVFGEAVGRQGIAYGLYRFAGKKGEALRLVTGLAMRRAWEIGAREATGDALPVFLYHILMQKNIVAKIVLALLAIALAGFVLYKCGAGFKEGLEDSKEHREGRK
jgi:hypothetical protein